MERSDQRILGLDPTDSPGTRPGTVAQEQKQVLAEACDLIHAWLADGAEETVFDAIEDGFMVGLHPAERDAVDQFPQAVLDAFILTSKEWVIADGWCEDQGKIAFFRDVILGPNGAPLTEEQRSLVTSFVCSEIRAFEIIDIVPDLGVWVADLQSSGSTLWVADRLASQAFAPGDFLAGRLLPGESRELSAGIFPFSRAVDRLELRSMLTDPDAGSPWCGPLPGLSSSERIITVWLRHLIAFHLWNESEVSGYAAEGSAFLGDLVEVN